MAATRWRKPFMGKLVESAPPPNTLIGSRENTDWITHAFYLAEDTEVDGKISKSYYVVTTSFARRTVDLID